MATKAKKKLEQQIKCTYADCFERFNTVTDMKKHKKYVNKHDYCHLCDKDFDDWDLWAAHNAEWSGKDIFGKTAKQYAWEKSEDSGVELNGAKGAVFGQKKSEAIQKYGEKKGEKYGKLKFHDYGCKFCGEKFKTPEGRQSHYNAHHPIDQNVKCPGCPEVFPRASGLIFHFEKNLCSKISAARFHGYLQHKEIITRLLEDPTAMQAMALKDCTPYIDAARDDDKGGGAALNLMDKGEDDDDEITWLDSYEPLAPDQAPVAPMMSIDQQTYPTLAAAVAKRNASGGVSLSEEMQALNIKNGGAVKPQQAKIEANPWPLPADYKPGDPLPTKPPVWGGSSSKELFKEAKATPMTTDWEKRLKEHSEKDHKSNILHHQFWNPTHEDYDAERFYDPMLEKYKCPFPGCDAAFLTPNDNNCHIAEEHAVKAVRCPSCFKMFKTYTGLISHCESLGSKCRLTHSSKFNQAIDLFSGGFLAVNVVDRPDISHKEDGYKARYMKYEATVPHDFIGKKSTTIGTKLEA
ncbi:hypothetical protein EJ08DRAFT_681732 [Tothia fuscella]|uniref:C2H2-type domain-containing protein n=1 Tax=Tothia fuscella TaxID=1048955 RepID=A0A9P4NJV1_9PEZI|nr:hypothetical protein EJ08DRAFT_681732 [Tothia fuscella]